ncbi:MAG: DUF1062 domain-containing protein [Myxococcales bacterium]|nr:DUF1062 domain-containing protein [Myxococcales bacterium]
MSGSTAHVRWCVVPLHTPRVPRHCPGCENRRLYYSSDKFRVNAHQRKVDVWLIYRCEHCDNSLNVTIIERTNVKHIDRELLQAYMGNDTAVAWRHAFDRDTLKRHGVLAEADVEWRLDVEPWPSPEPEETVVDVHMDYPVNVRVDRLLAAGLGLARGRVADLLRSGRIRLEPVTLSKASRRANTSFRVYVAAGVVRSAGGAESPASAPPAD